MAHDDRQYTSYATIPVMSYNEQVIANPPPLNRGKNAKEKHAYVID